MDSDLRHYLDENFARIDERITEVETRLNERIEASETRLNERVEKTETNLLTAFHGWARPMEIRVHGAANYGPGI